MTLAIQNGTAAVALPSASDTGRSLVEWAAELDAAGKLAGALAGTSFVPAAFRGKPAECAAAILTGAAMGLPPTTALQMFYVINGRVGSYADAKKALVLAAGHRVWTEHRSDTSVTVCGQRKGDVNVQRITITMDEAKRAGWTTNANYAKTPADMLQHRADDRMCRMVAPEVLYGIPVVDELEDLPPVQASATVDRPAPLTIAELVQQKSTPAEPVSAPPVSEQPPTTALQGITGPQSKKLHALFNEAGIAERESRLSWVSDILGREVASSSDLTRVEAGQVIEQVQAFITERQREAPEEGEPS